MSKTWASLDEKTKSRWWPVGQDRSARFWHRHPFVGIFLVIIWPNAVWSIANLLYNDKLIVSSLCNERQRAVFWDIAVPLYTGLSWSVGMAICAWLVLPLLRLYRAQETPGSTSPQIKHEAEKRLVNLPWYQLWCNSALWLPGGIYFPAMICLQAQEEDPVSFLCRPSPLAPHPSHWRFVPWLRMLIHANWLKGKYGGCGAAC